MPEEITRNNVDQCFEDLNSWLKDAMLKNSKIVKFSLKTPWWTKEIDEVRNFLNKIKRFKVKNQNIEILGIFNLIEKSLKYHSRKTN